MNTQTTSRQCSWIQANERWATKFLSLLLLLILPAVVQAQSYTNSYGIWYYTTTNDTITITNYSGPGGDVTIPDRIPDTTNGLPVTTVGGYHDSYGDWFGAFSDCTSLASVTIGTNVTSIGTNAFSDCTSLASVTIGTNVTSIGDSAFAYCTSLSNLTIPNSVTSIGDGAFYGCGRLTSVTIPNGVTSIGDSAFEYCSSLTSVTIGNGVTSIGDYAFAGCTSLTAVIIPNSVTSIGDSAFYACSSLTSVTIGNGVTSIGGSAFAYCTSLMAITVDTRNSVYSDVDGVLFNQSLTTLVQYPGGVAGSYTIPGSVTNIGDSAFAGCLSLTSVYFQGNAPSLGASVFSYTLYGPWGEDPQQVWDPATVFYLPGTTGWGTTLGGLPTALWPPQIQSSNASFGVQTNQFGFNINWASGMSVAVDASTNLANPIWTPITTNTLTSSTVYFSDPEWSKYPTRFYRLRWP